MAKNGQERSNQIADQFMRMASRIPTKKVAITIEEQMEEIRERRKIEAERKAKEAARLKAHKEKMAAEQAKYLKWKADQEAKKNK
jgi:hypothetical protein